MTPLLEKAFARAAGLPPDAQDALALLLLDDLGDLVPWLGPEAEEGAEGDDGWDLERAAPARAPLRPADPF